MVGVKDNVGVRVLVAVGDWVGVWVIVAVGGSEGEGDSVTVGRSIEVAVPVTAAIGLGFGTPDPRLPQPEIRSSNAAPSQILFILQYFGSYSS